MYNSQLTAYDTQIAGISGIIAQIDAQTVNGDELASCLADDRSQLATNLGHVVSFKQAVEAKIARLQAGWTGQYATYVNEINTTFDGNYSREIERWLAEDKSDKYNSFFTMYSQAANDFQKERLLKMTFGV